MTSLYSRITPHFTQDLLSPGLKIGYYDEGGVWQFVAPSLALRLPLRAIEWKNLVGVTKTIDRLPINFIAEPERESVMPIVCIYVIKCEDLDRYKSTVRTQIAQWIDRMNAAKVDWMLLYVPLGTRTKAGSGAGSSSSGSGGNRHVGHSAYKKIFDKIKNDFSNKKSASHAMVQSASGGSASQAGLNAAAANDSARSPAGVAASAMSNFSNSFAGIGSTGANGGVSADRICKIDTLEGASVVGTQSTHELQWTELLMRLRRCIMEAFECKCLQYEEEARVMDAKVSTYSLTLVTVSHVWLFVCSGLSLRGISARSSWPKSDWRSCTNRRTYWTTLSAILMKLEAIFSFLVQSDKRFQTTGRSVTSTDPMFETSPLAIDLAAIHRLIASNQAPPLFMRLYFFSRQIRTLYLMGDFRQLIQRAITFITTFHEELVKEQSLQWFQPHLWAVGACFEIAYACELSWSGHDYQISTASIPEGVSFALTPEVMAGQLGDILYLARRILKKSARTNGWWKMLFTPEAKQEEAAAATSSSDTGDWFKSLAAMFQAGTPELFQRCVWEVSHLASLHFSRTGRHRLAVFLGGECARYHLHHREFESASRLFRSHARQCEEDKWWSLVSDCVKRICESELALGRSEQAVAACFSMLEIAQASKAEVSRAYLDQLLTSLVQSLDQSAQRADDGDGSSSTSALAVKMGELIRPSITIETMQSPESDLDYGDVRVTLSLSNQFPAGIHIESVRVRFTKCEEEEANDDAAASLVAVDLGGSPPPPPTTTATTDDAGLVELSESNVYLYERASVNLIFLYGDVDVGVYTCAGLECSVAGNTFPLFSKADLVAIRFEIPRRQSSLRLEIDGPPLLIPASMEEIRITIDTDDDAVHHGILEIALPEGCDVVSLSHTQLSSEEAASDTSSTQSPDEPETAGLKCVVRVDSLPPKTRVTCSVWVVVGDLIADGDAPMVAPIAASLRYDPGPQDSRPRTELRRCERAFRVLRPLTHTATLKRVADQLFLAVSLQCNDQVGVYIRNYALLGHEETAVGWRVAQDLNDHLLGLRLRPNEAVHLVFGLQIDAAIPLADSALLRVGIEYDASDSTTVDTVSDRRWRADCLVDISLAPVQGAAYRIDVQPKQALRQGNAFPRGEDITFTVSIEERRMQEANLLQIHPTLLLCLDEASESEWILLGKQCETLDFQAKQHGVYTFQTVKRLMPLRVGRLRFPRFHLRVEPAQPSPTGDAIIRPAQVFSPQHAQSLLVV